MKSKIAASISPLSAAVCKRFRNSASSRSIVEHFGSHHSQINFRAAHSSVIEDEFMELGPEISDCSAKQIRLVTEKPEYFMKLEPSRRGSFGRSIASDKRSKPKATMLTLFTASPTSLPKLTGHADASTSSDDSSEISNMEKLHCISIKNISSTVGLYELVEALSIFGKVTAAVFVNSSDGLKCCRIKFESVDSSRRAVSAGKIKVRNQEYPVHPLDILAVRIKNINQNTSDHDIYLTCKSLGEFVGLARTKKDSVDAFFDVRSDGIRLKLLKRLNSTMVDDCCWSADVLRTDSSDERLESQIYDHTNEIRRQLFMHQIDLEDLETLLFSLLQIEEHASFSDANQRPS